MMKQSFMTGFSFSLTSGVMTPLGLMVGLNAGTHSRLGVIGGGGMHVHSSLLNIVLHN